MLQLSHRLPSLLDAALRRCSAATNFGEALESLAIGLAEYHGASDCAVVARFAEGSDHFAVSDLRGCRVIRAADGTTSVASIDEAALLGDHERGVISPPYTASYSLSSRSLIGLLQDAHFEGVVLLRDPLNAEASECGIVASQLLSAASRLRGQSVADLGSFAHDVKHFVMVADELLRHVDAEDVSVRGRANAKLKNLLRRLSLRTSTILLADKDDSGMLSISTLPISLSELAEDALANQAPRFASSSVRLHAAIDVGLAPSALDPAVFPSVIENLLDNALKYSANGTAVGMRTFQQGETAVLEVRNPINPVGTLRADDLENGLANLFRRHYRGANATHTEGNGLGLYLVRRIVEAHNGGVDAEMLASGELLVRVKVPLSEHSDRERNSELEDGNR